MTFETIHSEVLYRGRAFNVCREEVRMPDGHVAQLDIVDHVGAVTILPIDEAGRIWFVRQYRHAAGVILLELPAGTLEVGESPDECAASGDSRRNRDVRWGAAQGWGIFPGPGLFQ